MIQKPTSILAFHLVFEEGSFRAFIAFTIQQAEDIINSNDEKTITSSGNLLLAVLNAHSVALIIKKATSAINPK